MATFLCGLIVEPKDIGLSQTVVEGSEAMRQRIKMVTGTRKQMKQFPRTEGAVLDAPLRNASWEVFVDFEVAQGVDPTCAQNLWDIACSRTCGIFQSCCVQQFLSVCPRPSL